MADDKKDSVLVNGYQDIKGIHKMLVGLIEVYIIGHGGMGLLHIYILTKDEKTD